MRREGVVLVLLVLACRAAALSGQAGDPLQVVGSVRTVTAATANHGSLLMAGPDGTVHAGDGLGVALVRIEAAARPLDSLTADLHLVQAASFSSADAGTGLALSPAVTRDRWLAPGISETRAPGVTADLIVDRAAVTWRGPRVGLTLGRQPITFGKAHFWNALDVFYPFAASAFDRDYKPGVDAVRVDVGLGEASGLTAVGVAGRRDGVAPPGASWYGSAALLHGYTDLSGWDLSAQGGKVQGGWHAGAAAAATIGPLDARVEGAVFMPEGDDPRPRSLTAVAGAGHRFASGLLVEGEVLYQGAARRGTLSERLALQQQGRLLQASPLVVGVVADRDLTSLLHGNVGLLWSAEDGSASALPGLVYSLSNEAELVAGALIGVGRRRLTGSEPASEFGAAPDIAYLEFKAYF